MLKIIGIFLLLLAVPVSLAAEGPPPFPECELIIDDFAQGIKPGWKIKSFKGSTEYTWIKDENRSYVKATSRGTASGLFYEIEFDPQQ